MPSPAVLGDVVGRREIFRLEPGTSDQRIHDGAAHFRERESSCGNRPRQGPPALPLTAFELAVPTDHVVK